MNLYTIGSSGKSARIFFGCLKESGIERVIDVRLRLSGQLAGFAKKNDLKFFLKEIIDCDYVYLPNLAPTDEILTLYRKTKDWGKFVSEFTLLMAERNIPRVLDKALFEDACLLCSEEKPRYCHRSLIAEILSANWADVTVHHLL